MLNTTAKELLNLDKNAFRAVHDVTGFNFNALYSAEKIAGNFTLNSIAKGKKFDKELTVLLIKETGWRSDKLMLVYATEYRTHITDFKVYQHTGKYSTKVDEYNRKGDFEDARKDSTTITYVLRQAIENVGEPKPEHRNYRDKIDLAERHIFIKANETYHNYPNHKYISSLNLKTTDGRNAYVEYRPAYTYSKEYTDPAQIIDKSGYIVCEKRLDLQRRADEVRKERAQQAFKATDNTAIIKALSERIQALKSDIVKALENANTYDSIYAIKEYLDSWNGLAGIYRDYERILNKDAEKSYNSIAKFNQDVRDINYDISKLASKLTA